MEEMGVENVIEIIEKDCVWVFFLCFFLNFGILLMFPMHYNPFPIKTVNQDGGKNLEWYTMERNQSNSIQMNNKITLKRDDNNKV